MSASMRFLRRTAFAAATLGALSADPSFAPPGPARPLPPRWAPSPSLVIDAYP
jgi:hypothetical protein